MKNAVPHSVLGRLGIMEIRLFGDFWRRWDVGQIPSSLAEIVSQNSRANEAENTVLHVLLIYFYITYIIGVCQPNSFLHRNSLLWTA